MKTLVFSVFILCFGLLFFAGVFGVPVNKGTENAVVSIGVPVIGQLPEIAAEQSIAISGTAHAKSFILLYVNGACVSETQATSSAGGLEGECAFAFEDVELADGENEIYVVSCLGRNKNGIEIQSEPVTIFYEPYGKKIIGSDGGTIVSRDLALELIVPQGALQSKTLISVERLDAPLGEIAYELQPTGLIFSEPATITLALSEEEAGWFGPKLIKVYLTSEGSEPELLPSIVDEETGIVTAEIGHFSGVSFRAPLQFTDVEFKEDTRTWTDATDGYKKFRKRRYFYNWDIAAGEGWFGVSSLNRFKGIKLVRESFTITENRRGEYYRTNYPPYEYTAFKPDSVGDWDENKFCACSNPLTFGAWNWREFFQCGGRGSTLDFIGTGYFYLYERWEDKYGNLIWEYESKQKGRLELLATTSSEGASTDVIVIDTLEYGE